MNARLLWDEDSIGYSHGQCLACGARWTYVTDDDRKAIDAHHICHDEVGLASALAAEVVGPPAMEGTTAVSQSDPRVGQYQAAVIACAMARQLLQTHDLEGILRAIGDAHALGPVLDPTLYRDRAKAMEEDRALLEAALPLARLGR